ncbi:MAG: peptide ABC transporter permease [Elusimicrobia bacterium CG_4_9_14_3_um_filter_62_55]|nr:MAG: peptide ABC transporter permease [Elusimicrobia bacterium CG22_combo_CG10-13_8_21_14_all_63_91]PJA17097.1 MAG: peptide ABC transporter permease [Elusimicrobia bacterium CG_4_10_14_0_2_um_filter_63_34]PJB26644.1 MAG: peptide ABC transporter permease [Elusimicrobia bacterium CG_4_9_14_3_um_filter_62_55]
MAKFILKRLAMLPLVLFGVTVLLFGLFNTLSPEMRASIYVKDPRQLAALDEVIRKYGLKDPFHKQYVRWIARVAKGDLGYSETAKMPVTEAIRSFFPATIELSVLAFIPIMVIGVWLGTLSAVYRDKWIDHFSRFVAITGYSLPSFVLGLLLLMVFYGMLKLFPPGRYSLASDLIINGGNYAAYTGMVTVDSLLNGRIGVFFDALKHLILPASSLTYITMALLVRITRSSMLEELGKDYVRTARAKGLPESVVINKHARRNAWIPVITIASILFVQLLGGVLITETVFAYPGIGRWVAQAAVQLDIPGVMGVALLTSTLFVLGNLVADILYAVVDPRIRFQ